VGFHKQVNRTAEHRIEGTSSYSNPRRLRAARQYRGGTANKSWWGLPPSLAITCLSVASTSPLHRSVAAQSAVTVQPGSGCHLSTSLRAKLSRPPFIPGHEAVLLSSTKDLCYYRIIHQGGPRLLTVGTINNSILLE